MSPLRTAGVALLLALAAAPAARAGFPASIETTVAPGGNSSISSPTLPADMRSATVDVKPATPADDPFFEDMRVVLSLQPTPGRRLLMCIGLYINVAHGIDESVELQFPEQVHPLAVLLLSACLHMAAEVDRAAQQGGSATAAALPLAAAAAACSRSATQVPATFTRVGRQWRATVDGTTAKLRKRGRLAVSCRRSGAGMTLKVRPAASGRSLRSVVGPRLRLGVYNPLDARGSGRLRVTFRR